MATSWSNSLGIDIPSGANASLLFMDGAGAVSYLQPTASGQVPEWNGTAWIMAATPVGTTPYNVISAATGALVIAANNNITNATSTTVSLPTTAAAGQSLTLLTGAATAIISQAASQQITGIGSQSTTVGATGSLTMPQPKSYVQLICTTANTIFEVQAFTGTLGWT